MAWGCRSSDCLQCHDRNGLCRSVHASQDGHAGNFSGVCAAVAIQKKKVLSWRLLGTRDETDACKGFLKGASVSIPTITQKGDEVNELRTDLREAA